VTWRDRAACLDVHPETFYPLGAEGKQPVAAVARAKAVCARCPVAAPCLAEAMDRRDFWGVFGGLTGEERAALQRRTRKPARSLVRYGKAGTP
jgi:WhiB family redox-sensing transcriptional regulator